MNLDWMADALCLEVGSEIFFPGPGKPPLEAVSVCRKCAVRQDCLEYALAIDARTTYPLGGVWGGTTERQRQRMKADRRRAS